MENVMPDIEIPLTHGLYVGVNPVGGHASRECMKDGMQKDIVRLRSEPPVVASLVGQQVDEAVAAKPPPGPATWRPTGDHTGVPAAVMPTPQKANIMVIKVDVNMEE